MLYSRVIDDCAEVKQLPFSIYLVLITEVYGHITSSPVRMLIP